MAEPFIEITNLGKSYSDDKTHVTVLKQINLILMRGQFLAIMGPSGSGKSTLLNIIGCLDTPSSGEYSLNGKNLSQASDSELSEIRGQTIGFVFQNFNLLHELTLYENVALPFLYNGRRNKHEIKLCCDNAIQNVGLSHRKNHKPAELSGGEIQRAAIARALAVKPKLILADEPTGNLDTPTGNEILGVLKKAHDHGTTILMVTHDLHVAGYADRVLTLQDGRFV